MALEKTLQNAENQVASTLITELQAFQKTKKRRFEQALRCFKCAEEFKKLVELLHPVEKTASELAALNKPLPRRRGMPRIKEHAALQSLVDNPPAMSESAQHPSEIQDQNKIYV